MVSPTRQDDSVDQGERRQPRGRDSLRQRAWEVRAQTAIDSLRSMAVAAAWSQRAPPPESEPPPESGDQPPESESPPESGPQPPQSASPGPATSSSFCVRYHHVLRQLSEAEAYLDKSARPCTWARGTRIEGAWGHIHNATVALLDIATGDQLFALAPRLLGLVQAYLDDDAPERRAVQPWFELIARSTPTPLVAGTSVPTTTPSAPGEITPQARAALVSALTATYERVGAEYQRLRRFQWTITGSAVVILMLVAGLVFVGWNYPEKVPLCFPDPDATATTAPAGDEVVPDDAVADEAATAGTALAGRPVCPSRDRVPATSSDTGGGGAGGGEASADSDSDSDSDADADAGAGLLDDGDSPYSSADVAVVLLFGLVGASLTSVPFVTRRSPSTSVPVSSIRVVQAVLKAAVGMVSAVVGLLLLRAGAVPGFTQIDTRAQVLGYALLFGAAQELVTRIVDDRSNTLIGTVSADATDAAAPSS